MSDRIKLATAMGWKHKIHHKNTPHESHVWRSPSNSVQGVPPDPEKNANDDYAVLEWMIARCKLASVANNKIPDWKQWDAFCCNVPLACEERLIGDYARAALKVIENE